MFEVCLYCQQKIDIKHSGDLLTCQSSSSKKHELILEILVNKKHWMVKIIYYCFYASVGYKVVPILKDQPFGNEKRAYKTGSLHLGG
jgi:hypothetical protein